MAMATFICGYLASILLPPRKSLAGLRAAVQWLGPRMVLPALYLTGAWQRLVKPGRRQEPSPMVTPLGADVGPEAPPGSRWRFLMNSLEHEPFVQDRFLHASAIEDGHTASAPVITNNPWRNVQTSGNRHDGNASVEIAGAEESETCVTVPHYKKEVESEDGDTDWSSISAHKDYNPIKGEAGHEPHPVGLAPDSGVAQSVRFGSRGNPNNTVRRRHESPDGRGARTPCAQERRYESFDKYEEDQSEDDFQREESADDERKEEHGIRAVRGSGRDSDHGAADQSDAESEREEAGEEGEGQHKNEYVEEDSSSSDDFSDYYSKAEPLARMVGGTGADRASGATRRQAFGTRG